MTEPVSSHEIARNKFKDKWMNDSHIIQVNDNTVKQEVCLDVCLMICILSIILPFIVCDLYFGFQHQHCLTIKFNKFDMNLKTWLLTDGFISIAYIVYLFIASLQEKYFRTCLIITGKILVGIYTVVWSIVGAVLFWRYIEPDNLCDTSLTTYLWVRIIIGLVASAAICCLDNKND